MKWLRAKHECQTPGCRRRALYISPGWRRVSARRDHDLCRQCYRSALTKLAVGHEGRRARQFTTYRRKAAA
jgi:hypothetical protein